MTERINTAVTALFSDSSLLAKFKNNPEKALRSFDLLECELDAVKSGDEQALLAHGLDPQLVIGHTVTPHWFRGLLGTRGSANGDTGCNSDHACHCGSGFECTDSECR